MPHSVAVRADSIAATRLTGEGFAAERDAGEEDAPSESEAVEEEVIQDEVMSRKASMRERVVCGAGVQPKQRRRMQNGYTGVGMQWEGEETSTRLYAANGSSLPAPVARPVP